MKLQVYNLNDVVKRRTKGKFKAFYRDEEFALIKGTEGFVAAQFDSSHVTYKSLDDEVCIDKFPVEYKKGFTDIDADIPHGMITCTLQEVMDEAGVKTVDSFEYFSKRAFNYHYMKKHYNLLEALIKIGINPDTKI